MTDDPVLHALLDLAKAVSKLEHFSGELAAAYGNAMQVLRDRVRCEPQLEKPRDAMAESIAKQIEDGAPGDSQANR